MCNAPSNMSLRGAKRRGNLLLSSVKNQNPINIVNPKCSMLIGFTMSNNSVLEIATSA